MIETPVIQERTPFFFLRFVLVVVVVFFAFQLIHIFRVIQNIEIDSRDIPVLNSEIIAVSVGIVVWKFIAVGIQSHEEIVVEGNAVRIGIVDG